MYTFLFACIPLIVLLVCCSSGKHNWKSFIPPVAIGGLVALVFYLSRKFVFFNRYTWTTDLASAVVHITVYDVIIPFVICMAVFCIFDRSKLVYKAESIAPLMLTFFAVMVPYNIISGDDGIASFMIFGKPLLYAGMPILVSVFATLGAEFVEKKQLVPGILFFVLGLPWLVVPAIVETLWYYSGNSVYIFVSAGFAVASVLIYLVVNIFRGMKKNK